MWYNNIRKLPFVPSPSKTKVKSRFYSDVTEALLIVPNLPDKEKCSSDIDIARTSALASLTPEIVYDNTEVRPRAMSGSETSKSVYAKHKRSKSTDGTVDDFGFPLDPRTPSSVKSNSFPRSSTPPVLKKTKKKVGKTLTLPPVVTGGLFVKASSPSLRGAAPLSILLSRSDHKQ